MVNFPSDRRPLSWIMTADTQTLVQSEQGSAERGTAADDADEVNIIEPKVAAAG